MYRFDLRPSGSGLLLLQALADGEQIDESPTIVILDPESGGLSDLAVGLVVAGVMVAAAAMVAAVMWVRRTAQERLWRIPEEEIEWPLEPVSLGTGFFGTVFLANYR